MLSMWLLALLPAALAQEPAAMPPSRWAAIEAGQGLSVTLVGMSVVFVGLTVLFLTMTLLRAILDRGANGARPAPVAAEQPQEALDPRVAAAIAVALQLELRRRTCAAAARGAEARQGSGWIAARGGQWAAQQQAFNRSRR